MLILLALPVTAIVAASHRYLQRCAPSNLLARRVRAQPPGFRGFVALLALAGALLIAMHSLTRVIASGAPGWLYIVVLVLAWDAIKMTLLAVSQVVRALAWQPLRRVGRLRGLRT